MPEISNIQTDVLVTEATCWPQLTKFRDILDHLGLLNAEIATAFDNFVWEIDQDSSFTYGGLSDLPFLKSNISSIPIRPHIMFFTIYPDVQAPQIWMNVEFFIETEKLQDLITREYYPNSYTLIKTLAFKLYQEFQQTGVYFTDEAQDGQNFDSISENNPSKLWEFDYAIIPNHLQDLYKECPPTHRVKSNDEYFEAWYLGEGRWQDPELIS